MEVSRIFFDTNLLIYLIEDSGTRSAQVKTVLERMSERGDYLLTSALTLGELLVKPLELGNEAMAERYETLLSSPGVTVVPFEKTCARTYAGIRRDRSIRPPDAMQLACAASARTDLFITNDDRLSRKTVPGIQFILPLDRAFL